MKIKIESSSNSVYKHAKKLLGKSERTRSSQYLAEGRRNVADAIKNGADIDSILVCEGTDFDVPSSIKVYELSPKLFDSLKQTVNSQGIMAIVNYSLDSAASIDFAKVSTLLYLDCVTDPGNMGTILRSADALGADAIILSAGCVDVFNPKVVRSAMASLMNVPIYTDDGTKEFFDLLKENGFSVMGTFPDGEKLCFEAAGEVKTVVVMGNEANGISDTVAGFCDVRVRIPMTGRAESLNVATAATVMLYELLRSKISREMISEVKHDG